MPRKMVWLGLSQIPHWNGRTRLRIVHMARGAVAFLLFLLPKPSVEAEQRQQMVPRATRSTVGFQLLREQWPGISEGRKPRLLATVRSYYEDDRCRFLSRQCRSRAVSWPRRKDYSVKLIRPNCRSVVRLVSVSASSAAFQDRGRATTDPRWDCGKSLSSERPRGILLHTLPPSS
jgi:hypothetical protein